MVRHRQQPKPLLGPWTSRAYRLTMKHPPDMASHEEKSFSRRLPSRRHPPPSLVMRSHHQSSSVILVTCPSSRSLYSATYPSPYHSTIPEISPSKHITIQEILPFREYCSLTRTCPQGTTCQHCNRCHKAQRPRGDGPWRPPEIRRAEYCVWRPCTPVLPLPWAKRAQAHLAR